MASFTTRIELVNPDSNDYELLHQEMRDREFYRVITFCGKWHDLPPGEYDRTSIAQMGQIYSDAGAAAQAVIDNKPLNDQQEPKNYKIMPTTKNSGRSSRENDSKRAGSQSSSSSSNQDRNRDPRTNTGKQGGQMPRTTNK